MKWAATLAAFAIAVAGCSGTSDTTSTDARTTPPTTVAATTSSSTTAPTTTSMPSATTTRPAATTELDPAVRVQLDWFIGLLNGATFDESDYGSRFAEVFRDEVPSDQFLPIVDQIGTAGTAWRIAEVEAADGQTAVVVAVPAAGSPSIRISLSVDGQGQINGLYVQPAEVPRLDDPPTTVEGAADRLDALGNLGVVVADVTTGECVEGFGRNAGQPVPLGSMFKLYVLAAVVDAVDQGAITWDQPVDVVDEYRSLPSGIVQNDPPNSSRTVRELAELMISISDNTATDHLLALVGRNDVEASQARHGHLTPELNEPFLSTRELFVLKLADRPDEPGRPGPVGEQYLAADVEGRRTILTEQVPSYQLDDLRITGWTSPIEVERLEWFASPLDLCRAMVSLHRDAEATRILAINPGVADDSGLWSSVGFKGGSEPGVLGMAWYLTAQDGSSSVVAGSVWNPDVAFDETEAVLLFAALRDLTG